MEKIEKQKDKNEPADFETAIAAAEFGKYSILLLMVSIPGCIATVYETTTMSYILPSAECDLELTLIDKGILNAATYAGMITLPMLWGFAADNFGRRKPLIIGFLLDAICVLCASMSQSKYLLMVFKYLGGVLMCGPYAILMSYLTEFFGGKHRSIVIMCTGIFTTSGTMMLPLIAWGLLPQEWNIDIFNLMTIHSWQVYVAVCALPSLFAGISILFLPESPKFLMTHGRDAEALEIFRTIFAINTGKSKDEYPIKSLVSENEKSTSSDNKEPKKTTLKSGLIQMKVMFQKPYLAYSLLVYIIQFCILTGLNTFRLWMPQLFKTISDFEQMISSSNYSDSFSFCDMIEYGVNKSHETAIASSLEDYICQANTTNNMYINTLIVSSVCLFGYFLAGSLINTLGSKRIMVFGLAISACSSLLLLWTNNSIVVLVIASAMVTIGSISGTAVVGVSVHLFPTTLRTLIVSNVMMFGRLGALIGNILFPYFMSMGCLPPVLMIGVILFIPSILCILLPKTEDMALH